MSKVLKVFTKNYTRQIQLEFKLQDFWVGAYWKKETYSHPKKRNMTRLDVWVCLIPCLPIHIIIFDLYSD